MPEVAWDTIINTLCHFLAKLAAGGMNMMCVCLASLIFCIVNTIVWAANVNIGFKLARLEIPPPQVIYRTLEDPRVPKLQEENRRIHNQVVDKDTLLENTRTRYDTDVGELEREIETLEGANLAQKAVIRGQLKMLASIDMTRSTYDQLKEKEKRAADLQKEKDLAIEDKKQSEAYFLKQLGDHFETIREVRWQLRVEKQEHALLRKEHACCQGQLDSREAISGLNIKSQRKRIQDLEKSMASKEETLQALLKEHEELIASQKAAKDAFEEQLKERDEIINTQKKAIQDLQARMNEQEESHASQKKSESASIKRKFDEEIKKMTDECNRSSDARKAAEEMLKTEKEARKAAEEALDTERKGRKAVEDELTAEKEARKAADEKLKAAEKQSEADLKSLQNVQSVLEDFRAEYNVEKNAQNSTDQELMAEIKAREAAEQACEVARQQSAADLKSLQNVQEILEEVRADLSVEEDAQNSANQKLLVQIEAREAAEAEVASLRARLATGRPPSNDEGTQTSNPPPSPGKIASDDQGTQTSTPPSPSKTPSDDEGTQTSGDSSEIEQPEAVNPTPAKGSPVEPASRSGEQCDAPGQPEASESNSA
jgi:hypothetical protein